MSDLFKSWPEGPALVGAGAGVLLAIALLLAAWRLLRGPTACDRLLAFDLMGGCVLAAMIWLAWALDRPDLLDAAVVLAAVGFVGTVVLARFVADGEGDAP